ncbi:MAG: diadenylate cyclase, partial [Mycoplasmataceae bacterium]|nr:diadenylate cyclase [Mycoplasmataceae bacterium]
MTWQEILIVIILALIFVQLIVLLVPLISKLSEKINKSKRESNVLSSSSKIRLINQLREAIEYLSQKKIGAIITIENNDNLDNLRTDGVKIDANIS